MKRLSALAMSAMMTVTMIPSNAFAADIEFSDGGQEAIEVQAQCGDFHSGRGYGQCGRPDGREFNGRRF